MIKKIVLWASTGLAVVTVTVYAVAYVTLPPAVDTRQFTGLADTYDAEILRDDYGVPHVYGRRNADVAFGLGYAQAEDDFDTLQTVILATRGTLASKNGMDAAAADFLVKWMGVWPVVEAGYDSRVSPQARAVAEAYADGVNHYLAVSGTPHHRNLLPVRGKDIVAGFLFKSPLFYGFDAVVKQIFSGAIETGGPDTAQGGSPMTALLDTALVRGSQGIAVSPAASGTQETLLLVNSHQPLTGPVAWYEARLKSEEGWDMVGGTFPGAPVILHGSGPTLGWANTVNKPDLVDVYRLTINPENPYEYRMDGAWKTFKQRTIPIEIKLWGPVRWTVKRSILLSDHGPVLEAGGHHYALRWAGMDTVGHLDQLLDLNTARTQADFEAALARDGMPSINYIYGDHEGHIAHYYHALFPNRIDDSVDWAAVLPGDRSDLIWHGYRPYSNVPATRDPASGVVFNANNRPSVSGGGDAAPQLADYPASMGVQDNMTNRAYRLRRLLADVRPVDAAALRHIKYDTFYDPDFPPRLKLEAFLADSDAPGALKSRFGEAGVDLQAALDVLRAWDFSTDAGSRSAALGTLTLYPHITAPLTGQKPAPLGELLLDAARHLTTYFGRLDPRWGDVNRLVRADDSWPLSGGPDVLRAVYGWPPNDKGQLVDLAGDGYIQFVRFTPTGRMVTSIHNFGSATLDTTSPHYSDQAPMFAAQQERIVPLDRATLLPLITRRTAFGWYRNDVTAP